MLVGEKNIIACLFLFLLTAALVPACAQQISLGSVSFPTTGKPEAQAHFLRGLAALHSFWFEEALEEFRAATAADQGFVMGYWGEAMAYNHPLWDEQNVEAARQALAKIGDLSQVTPREQAYVEAVRALYGSGDKNARDRAYSAAMEKVYRQHPQDDEAACFYALSLLGLWRPGEKSFRNQMQAGAIVLDVYRRNPNHPGAAHYIIHSFDDPEHAILALPAARRYASIAPEAHHARHMPAHIFLQLGMWPEAAASNESSWATSVAWVERKKLDGERRDFHSLHWLMYVYLQQGRYAKAEEMLRLRQNLTEKSSGGSAAGWDYAAMRGRYTSDMAAMLIVETEQWQRAAELFPPAASAAAAKPDAAGGTHSHGAPATGRAAEGATRSQVLGVFIPGLAAARTAQPEAAAAIAALTKMRAELTAAGETYRAKMVEIAELEVTALNEAAKGNMDKAITAAGRASQIEEELSPPSGPPDLVKPSHELYGEILLRAGRPKDAAAQFRTALLRQPNRARSLLGAARAADKSGDTAASAEAYAKLVEIWKSADPQLAELREAQDFLRQYQARTAGNGR